MPAHEARVPYPNIQAFLNIATIGILLEDPLMTLKNVLSIIKKKKK